MTSCCAPFGWSWRWATAPRTAQVAYLAPRSATAKESPALSTASSSSMYCRYSASTWSRTAHTSHRQHTLRSQAGITETSTIANVPMAVLP
eukprot:scaffold8176_cov430-Prasinococcus_capsulatus_cf.AAC.2